MAFRYNSLLFFKFDFRNRNIRCCKVLYEIISGTFQWRIKMKIRRKHGHRKNASIFLFYFFHFFYFSFFSFFFRKKIKTFFFLFFLLFLFLPFYSVEKRNTRRGERRLGLGAALQKFSQRRAVIRQRLLLLHRRHVIPAAAGPSGAAFPRPRRWTRRSGHTKRNFRRGSQTRTRCGSKLSEPFLGHVQSDFHPLQQSAA